MSTKERMMKEVIAEWIENNKRRTFVLIGGPRIACEFLADELDSLRSEMAARDVMIAKLSESVELLTATVKLLREPLSETIIRERE